MTTTSGPQSRLTRMEAAWLAGFVLLNIADTVGTAVSDPAMTQVITIIVAAGTVLSMLSVIALLVTGGRRCDADPRVTVLTWVFVAFLILSVNTAVSNVIFQGGTQ